MSLAMQGVICDGFNGPGALRIGRMPETELRPRQWRR
jgi:hypothetical protein